MIKNYLYLITFLVFTSSYSQNDSDVSEAKITSVFENYFNLEREAIHLHLNKTTFLNNETIWFKGYIINRKNSKPFFTSNVFVQLLDENGKQISEQLLFASNGVLSGKIDLKSSIPSGRYYIQTYTNWMNNFSEDESTISGVTIINPSQGVKNYNTLNLNSLKVNIHPEGGNYVKGIENAMGISLLDCMNNTIEDIEGNLQTLDGEILRTFKLNKFGYGKMIVPTSDKKLKIVFNHNDKLFEKELPQPTDIGLGLIVNNFSDENKAFLNLNTNASTLKTLETKRLFLVISKDEKSIIQEFKFDNHTKKDFIIEKKSLFNGINTLRIIDNELNQWCERLMYSDSIQANSNKIISINKRGVETDQINLVGLNSLSESSISIAVLPENTKANDYNKTDINVGLNINPYLINSLENPSYYFKNTDRIKKLELDLLLVNQSEIKYNWNNMKMNIPKTNYTFDIGLGIKGKVEDRIKNKTEHKAKLLSHIAFISLESDINEKGEYSIDKFVVADSSYLDLSLLKLPDFKKVDTKLTPLVLNRNRPFYKPFKIKRDPSCSEFEYIKTANEYPKLASGTIVLEEVEVENKSNKPKLTFANEIGNFNLRGFKIDASYTMPLLHFISSQGFGVTRERGEIGITNKHSTSLLGGQSTPEITINDRRLFSFNELDYMQMSEIDEIFLNRHVMIPGMMNKQGVIKIYTKKTLSRIIDPETFKFFIEKGFSKSTKYKTEKYIMSSGKGFENYGAIGWSPTIISDEQGRFEFDIYNFKKENILIDIEGINNDGQIFHQELILNVMNN